MAKPPTPRSQDQRHQNNPSQSDTLVSAQWSGPLPPPGALDHFNRIIPDGANRIMLMIEQEQAHRIAHETKELDGLVSDFRRSHWLGAGLGALAVGALTHTIHAAHLGGSSVMQHRAGDLAFAHASFAFHHHDLPVTLLHCGQLFRELR